ncbi:3-oxoacyl-[acyl-carrier-protein] reductase FabG [Candida viswanathii]|uniref:3-oxoacyl-[acyl-carrier-protein] reductase FabG n=1 Tax=Candida viswanathii TaxID=5486 RepID=A0A367Y9B8_9ASCO|nr:3-oxoacyl-[acyl-carrier-protein] reductase FabG [Candida viswanathii]
MFKGQTALVTGGSRGIGLAISKKLALEGATVTLLARDERRLQASLQELSTQHGQQHTYHALDLLKLLHTKHQHDVHLGSPSMLVNCAGVTNHSLLHRTRMDEIYDTVNLNLTVPIVLTQMVLKDMIRNSRKTSPAVLNILSVLSMTQYVVPGTSVYAASKAGLLGFTKSLAAELKGKVRVNALMPGLVKETDMGSGVVADVTVVSIESF